MKIIPANYVDTGVQRFKGNPFIEAMPPLELTKLDFLNSLSHYPQRPTDTIRRAGEIVRTMEMSILNDVVFPFPEYQKAGVVLATIMRDSYVARNPLKALDRQRRHALATGGSDGLPFPADWKSSAKGHSMLAVSGMGKTTFANSFLLRYPQIIQHGQYKGEALQCFQVVYVVLRVPHDGTLKSLCLQFFEEIDKLLKTNYTKQAHANDRIAQMMLLMSQVATAVSLGFLVIDEAQNLRYARGGNAEYVLNLFSEVIERLGISLLMLATPAVQAVLEGSVRNTRKLASCGVTVIRPMAKNDPQWDDFCDTYWDYTFVKRKGKLDKAVRDAWHEASAGNSAFAALAFMLSQRNEIGGREIVDAAAFRHTAATDMAFLQPAIAALRSGNPDRLRAFDDLLFSDKYRELRRQLGARDAQPEASNVEEFDDLKCDYGSSVSRTVKKRKSSGRASSAFDGNLPMENPLALCG
jgi:hypothetical protein